jgi:hypothetical protein
MELPDWVVDEMTAKARGAVPLLLVAKLFRHGSAVVDPATGGRRAYWSGQLPRLTGASKRALDAAVDELTALGVLRVHGPLRAGAARGYSVGYDVPAWGVMPGSDGPVRGVVPVVEQGAEVAGVQKLHRVEVAPPSNLGGAENATPSESRAYANGGGGDQDPFTGPVGLGIHHHHSSGFPREQILRTLRRLDVDRPGALLATHGPVRVSGALEELAGEMRRGRVWNPAGWLVMALVDRERVFEEPSGGDALAEVEEMASVDWEWAERQRKYGGPLQAMVLARQRTETFPAVVAGVARRVEQEAEAVQSSRHRAHISMGPAPHPAEGGDGHE